MPRIPVVPDDDAGPMTKLAYRISRRRYGAVPQPVAITAHHHKLMYVYAVTELSIEKAATVLPANVRQLAEYRVATSIGCSWCVDFGTMLQRKSGLDVERLHEIDDYETSPLFTDTERKALAYADAMTAQPMRVTDEQVDDLDRLLGHAGLVELTFMIAVENTRSRFNHALGITDQGFTSGDACRVPLPAASPSSNG